MTKFGLLVGHGAVTPCIVKRIGIIKRVADAIVDVGLRHFGFFALLRVIESGFLCNFV